MADKPASKILLVDDEPGLRESVQAYLEDSNFQVRVASNAAEGWDMLQKETPNVLISDIMMPQVDGYQFLKQVRDDVRFQALPVVFLTARGMRRFSSNWSRIDWGSISGRSVSFRATPISSPTARAPADRGSPDLAARRSWALSRR